MTEGTLINMLTRKASSAFVLAAAAVLALASGSAQAQNGPFFGGPNADVSFSMTNFSNHTVNVIHTTNGRFHIEKRVGPGETFRGVTSPNEIWGWADARTNDIYKSAKITSWNRRMDLRESDIHIEAHEPQPVGYEMTVMNKTNQTVYVSREIPRMGMPRMTRYATLGSWASVRLPLEPGMKWMIEDTRGNIIKSATGDPRKRSTSVVSGDFAPREVSLTLTNQGDYTISVSKLHGSHRDHVGRLRPWQRVTIKGYPGTKIYLSNNSTGRVFKTITLGSVNAAVKVGSRDGHSGHGGHGGHGSGGHGGGHAGHGDDHSGGGIGRGQILKALGNALEGGGRRP